MEAESVAPATSGADPLIAASDCARRCEVADIVAGTEVAVTGAGNASLFRKLDPAPGIAAESGRRVPVPKRVGGIGEVAVEPCPEAAVTPLGRPGSPC